MDREGYCHGVANSQIRLTAFLICLLTSPRLGSIKEPLI